MTHSAASFEIDLSWRMREREAQLLAGLLRSSRLTVLYGEPGYSRSELLSEGVLPLLRRRTTDTAGQAVRESRVVIPFSDRRAQRAGASSPRVAERVVVFGDWGTAPLDALRRTIFAGLPSDLVAELEGVRLADALEVVCERLEAQLLILLDGFEQFWNLALGEGESARFVDELTEAVNRRSLRVNFLLSVSEECEARLGELRHRIPGFDDSTLRLLRWQSVVKQIPVLRDVALPPVPAIAAAERTISESPPAQPSLQERAMHVAAAIPTTAPAPTRARSSRNATPPAPIKAENVYAFIESTLSKTASAFEPWHEEEGSEVASREPFRARPQLPQTEFSHVGTQPRLTEHASAIRFVRPGAAVRGGESWFETALQWIERRVLHR